MNRGAVGILIILAACKSTDPNPVVLDADSNRHCTTGSDCEAGEWCNPGPETCASRASQVEFDRDIYPKIMVLCATCHLPTGPGAKDVTGSGVLALFDQGPERTWQVLTAGGTDCSTDSHRVCVDEPKYSLMVQRLLPPNAVAVELPAGYNDPWIQTVMSWAASGAPRPGSQPLVDAGVDAPLDTMPDAPDAMPVCPADALPSTNACSIAEPYGVFVSPAGNDTNPGTRAAPFATFTRAIAAARATQKRVYACGGTYRGNVVVDSTLDGTTIFGGLDCTTWTYDATAKPVISAPNIPLIVDGVVTGVRFEDIKVVADDAVTHGQSSIAMLVRSSNNVSLVRSELIAGTGAAGSSGTENPSFLSGTKGGEGERACPCVDPTACPACDPWLDPTCGDNGVNYCGGTEVSGGTSSSWSEPGYGLPLEMAGGAPGISAGMSCYYGQSYCSNGEVGANGIDYATVPATGEPELVATGWRGVAGVPGPQGGPGQGGGAGGNGTNETYESRCYPQYPELCEDTSYADRPSGGGGGGGGCGGLGGSGGEAGGASISLVSLSSDVELSASTLAAVAAGNG
nr:DUF1565 domain-containing protein [Deltaproteobacteria bacterium]